MTMCGEAEETLRNVRSYIPRHNDVPDQPKEIHVPLIIIHPSLVSTISSIQAIVIVRSSRVNHLHFA